MLLSADAASADQGGAALAAQNCRNRTRLADREHNDRHTIFPGKREGRRVHHLQIALDRLLVAQAVVSLGLGVLLGIGTVDAVHVRCLEHGIAVHFGGT